MPEQPISNPLRSFNSDPGKIEKFFNFKCSNKLYELSFTPIIFSGKRLTNFSTLSLLNL